MRRKRGIPKVLAALAPLLASCPSGTSSGTAGEGYNVLLISLDSTRRDLLGAYGYSSARAPGTSPSPNLDELAARGVLLLDAYATSSWTLPSHMTLLSGQPELVHAVDIDYLRPDPSRRTLAEVLKERGYLTAGFFSGPYLDPRFGFDEGFDRYEACYGPELAAASARVEAAYERADAAERTGDAAAASAARAEALKHEVEVDGLSHRDVSSTSVASAAAQAIEQAAAQKKPFFVFAHFFDPHYDYVPPPPYDVFDPDYGGGIDGKGFWTNPKVSEIDRSLPSGRRRVIGDRDLEHVRALYAGELRATDAEVGKLLAKLRELGLAERTLVIVTADHGDEFFEHDAIGHRRTLFEEVVRVPMILSMPGVLPEGGRVGGLVANNDVYGTVLELLGLPSVPGTHTHSMVELIRGESDAQERAVLGRLVTAVQITLQTPLEGAKVDVPGTLIKVQDTYRKGPIKITRTREWPEPSLAAAPAGVRDELARARERGHAREVLTWVDVERHPEESATAQMTDFSSSAARAALQEFHDVYAELVRDRASAGTRAEGERPQAGMEGLGYTDGAEPVASDLFVLPPPGAELLRTLR